MTKEELIKYISDTNNFPFFGGFIVPQGINKTITVGEAFLDVIIDSNNPIPSADAVYTVYFYDVSADGLNCSPTKLNIYVRNNDTDQEVAYFNAEKPISKWADQQANTPQLANLQKV